MFDGGGCNILNMDIRVRHMQTQILALLCTGVSSSMHYVTVMSTDNLELVNEKIHDQCLAHTKLQLHHHHHYYCY